jgi:hypothetical protein
MARLLACTIVDCAREREQERGMRELFHAILLVWEHTRLELQLQRFTRELASDFDRGGRVFGIDLI